MLWCTRLLKGLLMHRYIRTTLKYAHVADRDRQKAKDGYSLFFSSILGFNRLIDDSRMF
jgi:hypothetical protein